MRIYYFDVKQKLGEWCAHDCPAALLLCSSLMSLDHQHVNHVQKHSLATDKSNNSLEFQDSIGGPSGLASLSQTTVLAMSKICNESTWSSLRGLICHYSNQCMLFSWFCKRRMTMATEAKRWVENEFSRWQKWVWRSLASHYGTWLIVIFCHPWNLIKVEVEVEEHSEKTSSARNSQ